MNALERDTLSKKGRQAQSADQSQTPTLLLSAREAEDYLDTVFAERRELWPPTRIEHLAPLEAKVRMSFDPKLVRPGGTISGPAMFMLADYGIYVALLGVLGRVPLAVTTNLSINFLRRPAQADLLAEVRLLKLGKRLAVGDVGLYSAGRDELVAHATGTYSIPPRRER